MQGEVIASRPKAADALGEYWGNVSGTPQDAVDCEAFCQFYQDDFSTDDDDLFGNLPPITCASLRKVLLNMRGKTCGPDPRYVPFASSARIK